MKENFRGRPAIQNRIITISTTNETLKFETHYTLLITTHCVQIIHLFCCNIEFLCYSFMQGWPIFSEFPQKFFSEIACPPKKSHQDTPKKIQAKASANDKTKKASPLKKPRKVAEKRVAAPAVKKSMFDGSTDEMIKLLQLRSHASLPQETNNSIRISLSMFTHL